MSSARKALLVAILFILTTVVACSQPRDQGTSQMSSLQPTRVVVRVLDLDVVATPTFPPPPPTLAPSPIPQPTPTTPALQASSSGQPAQPAKPTPTCTNLAEFVKNLTIAENTLLESNQAFAKLWRVKNVGTCTWTTDYALVFVSGDAMSGVPRLLLQQQVNPGDTLDLRVDLITPVGPLNVIGNWMLQDSSGVNFGIGQDGSQPLIVAVNVKPIGRPTPG